MGQVPRKLASHASCTAARDQGTSISGLSGSMCCSATVFMKFQDPFIKIFLVRLQHVICLTWLQKPEEAVK
jgi:hypothetical protein